MDDNTILKLEGQLKSKWWNIQKMINNKTNIMYGGGGVYMNDKTSTTITPEQMNIIIENYKLAD